ncbi:MAG TPA: aldose 1-epimerase family protein [Arachnia sp.]|nr:aldose 1-epimerase family protein [Arachnia sp.]HMT86483.1 aldose 1-epimerase family protein [Arachnia sp.]
MTIAPTGTQYPLSVGRSRAVVTEVGAVLRSLTVDGRELLWTFAEDQAPRSSMGRQLIPWPNRIRDGRYRFGGGDYQLPITEVPRHNASHGLGVGLPWELVSHTDDAITQRATYYPQAGWPFVLTAEITHRLSAEGIAVTVEARNDGPTELPYGYGVHPYFAVPEGVETARLRSPFSRRLLVDERMLPTDLVLSEGDYDLSEGVTIGGLALDTAFTGASGAWEVELTTAASTITVWADESLPWCQLFIPASRDAVAVEPMTCGPDAFNPGPTHDDLLVLRPGDTHRARWGIRVA